MSQPTLPTVSVVIPSLNQAAYLDAAIRSVLDQGYPFLELGVVDGGSSDGSVEVIRSVADRLAWWSSEPDRGQYDALNKGFARTSGEVMGWLNSDDLHLPWTLSVVGELFARFPEIEWLTSLFPLVWDARGRAVAAFRGRGFDRAGFFRGDNLPRKAAATRRWIQQESTFWRRTLWNRAGSRLDHGLHLAGDYELWCRFFKEAPLVGVETPLAGFRAHGDQRSLTSATAYADEARAVHARHGGRLRGRVEELVFSRLFEPMPRRPRRWLARLGLVSDRLTCRHAGPGGDWQLVTG